MSNYKKLINSLKKEKIKVDKTYLDLIKIFPLKELKSKKEYKVSLKIAEHLIDYLSEKPKAKNSIGISTYLSVLSLLISNYENEKKCDNFIF